MEVIMNRLNAWVVDPYILGVQTNPLNDADWFHVDPSYSMQRQLSVAVVFLWIGAMIPYFTFCTATYWYYFTPKNNNIAMWKYDGEQLQNEIWTSVWSSFLMAGMTAPIEIAVVYGYGRVYLNVSDYGWGYFFFSIALFLVFTDSLIYWIHRILHWPSVYPIHKLHHRYQDTTPFSAFSFHPLDGWSQGFPYHLFAFVFPMHNVLYLGMLFMVGLWTMNIHDRFSFRWFGINGAAHHTIHHTKFLYNYGQYFTFWDRFYKTFLDPFSISPYKDENAYKTKIWGKGWNTKRGALEQVAMADAIERASKADANANGNANGNGNGHAKAA